ncbi:DAK2 domain-containing protein [Streptomyces filamentosus]|uniref:Dihydroxyacetone kinase n=1 Tax=Streptomyces filamentosus TaxID=67294 RepID=A0A919BDQ0_STRFL|nr:DAK2 domain-containing protein [Streptomyces filamentosus]GHF83706.1 dihydroxyacetone kinase [Streptomyces filamentosus]
MSRAPQPFDPAVRSDERLVLDAEAVRAWSARTAEALGRERAAIDAINVYPVADGDTGTNLYLTADAAHRAVEAVFTAPGAAGASAPDTADAVRALAHGALLGARGNSGTILSQLLRGMAGVLAEAADGDHLARALDAAARAARAAVAHPEEGTILTVATAAAAGCAGGGTLPDVARRAHEAAGTALEATPGQLAVLGRAGVVDAGGRGLVTVLGALVETVTGRAPRQPSPAGVPSPPLVPAPASASVPASASAPASASGEPGGAGTGEGCGPAAQGPAYEVLYLLEAGDAAVDLLKARLDALGDSLVVVGGDGLWNVHVHVDDPGAAVEAGVEAGRPHRIRITHFASTLPAPAPGPSAAPAPGAPVEEPGHAREERAPRAVVAVLPGEGLAGLCAEAGATTVQARPGEPPAGDELLAAVRRAHAREVVLLPNDTDLRAAAAAAAERARAEGIRVALIPTRAAVQGIAALAVHEPGRSFDEDVVAMTAAAGATRYAELAVAERQSFTSAGVCQAGDVLGLIEGDVAVIGQDLTETARTVLDRMLQAGGELVTLVVADGTPPGLADTLETHVRRGYLAVDTVTYHAGEGAPPLLIGVE